MRNLAHGVLWRLFPYIQSIGDGYAESSSKSTPRGGFIREDVLSGGREYSPVIKRVPPPRLETLFR